MSILDTIVSRKRARLSDVIIDNSVRQSQITFKARLQGLAADGRYRLQPIYVDDLAALMVEHGKTTTNVILDAIGPETFTYRGLVNTIGEIIGCPRPILALPPWMAYAAGNALGWLMRDVMITRQEVQGLMADLLYVNSQPLGTTRLTEWVREYRDRLGQHYSSELKRRLDRKTAFQSI